MVILYSLTLECFAWANLTLKLFHYQAKTSPRKHDDWFEMAKQYCRNVTSPRDGKTVYIGSDWKTVTSKQFNTKYTVSGAGYEITERTIDKYGQFNLVPDIEVEAWWTNLGDPDDGFPSLVSCPWGM